MADALIAMLLDRLASTTYEYMEGKVKLVLNVEKEVEEFAGNLQAIQAVLEDAEQRQVKEANVRNWLEKLKDISYDMGDVLDEWNTVILKQQVEKEERDDANAVAGVPKKKVSCSIYPRCFCFGQVSRVSRRRDIALKIKDLNERLTVIDKQRSMYKFQLAEKGVQQPERLKTSSYVDISKIFGRENEKAILITKLLSSDSSEGRGIHIIPIVGMGGMGKTTLAQLAYNDDRIKTHFEKRIWVCVSHPFDEIRIAKAISGDNNPTTSNELDTVLQCMCTSLEGKKFLLVLDDVWTEDRKKWEPLEIALIQSGAQGSRILVTTRKHEVANMMRATTHVINLGELSKQFCLSIFNHMAFFDEEFDKSNEFGDIAKELVKRCNGLPLAAKSLGSLMRNKRKRIEWQKVLDSKIWDLDKEVEQEVFQPLLLSYYDLAPVVKSCLLYCAIFPKGYIFKPDKLINFWMAQDYLNSRENKDKGMIGRKYFDNLVARSFFLDFEKDYDGRIIRCKMHDIVHDFVQFFKNECLIVEANGATNEFEVLGDNKVRHLTLTHGSSDSVPVTISSYNCQSLRSFSTFSSSITTIDSNFVLQMKCLRTLNLSGNDIKELPKEIGELVHLRHIDLSLNNLEILPDTICDLCNLYTLDLTFCSGLDKLPEKMGKLINLKHLYIEGCTLEYLPKGIGRLRSFRRLDECPLFCGDKDEALQFADLRTLNLEGSLIITLLGNVNDQNEVEKAQLWDKKQLSHLTLDFKGVQYRHTSSKVEILNALRPHQDLASLCLSRHTGITWPNWITSLHNLRFLTVNSWDGLEFLPPFGILPSLERLSLVWMPRVKKVGGEFLGIEEVSFKSSSSFFPKLKQLDFERILKWEEWKGVEGWKKEDSEITIMPCLSSLKIRLCDKLITLPDFLFKTPLKNLEISYCNKLEERYRKGSGEEWPKISRIPNVSITGHNRPSSSKSWIEMIKWPLNVL